MRIGVQSVNFLPCISDPAIRRPEDGDEVVVEIEPDDLACPSSNYYGVLFELRRGRLGPHWRSKAASLQVGF